MGRRYPPLKRRSLTFLVPKFYLNSPLKMSAFENSKYFAGNHDTNYNAGAYDPRFPSQIQQRSCFSNYVDYHRCVNLKGDDYEPCNYYKAQFMAMCFNWQIEKFDEQREKGAFPAKLK